MLKSYKPVKLTKDCLITILAFTWSSRAVASKWVWEATSRGLTRPIGSNVADGAASVAFGSRWVAFVITIPGCFVCEYGIVSINNVWEKIYLPPDDLVSDSDFLISSGEQESTWLQFWHSLGVPEQLPPKSSGKQLPACLPGLDGPT